MRKLASFFFAKQTTVGSAAFILMSMVAASRILGLIRDRMLSARFGPDELGVYFAAFRLPNLLFELLVLGALTSSFIPVFTRYLAKGEEQEAWKMSSILINLGLVIFLFLAFPLFVWSVPISRFLAPGFSDQQIMLMAQFTQIMILFQVPALLVGNFFTGIIQSYNIFLIPAAAPVIYNLGIIGSILFFSTSLGLYAPVVGVGIGAFLFMLIQLPLLLSLGYRHRMQWQYKHSGVVEVGKLMGPRTFGLAVSQIDTTVDLMLASLLGARMVTIFNFAQHLQQLPVGLFGATIAQAALPLLSQVSLKENLGEFKKTLMNALHQILFFVLPISILFMVLRIPMVRLVFGASRFDWQATVLTGMTLSAFSLSLGAQAISQILARAFYALYDTKTPVMISIVSILLNTILSIIFIKILNLPVWSLGLSTSIASFVNAILLLWMLDSKIGGFPKTELLISPFKMLLASLITGVTLYVPLKLLDQLVFDTTRTFGLVMLTGIASAIGLTTYFFLAWVMGVSEVKAFAGLLSRVKRKGTVILEPASEVVNNGVQDKLS